VLLKQLDNADVADSMLLYSVRDKILGNKEGSIKRSVRFKRVGQTRNHVSMRCTWTLPDSPDLKVPTLRTSVTAQSTPTLSILE
jgi:hypothetical protein